MPWTSRPRCNSDFKKEIKSDQLSTFVDIFRCQGMGIGQECALRYEGSVIVQRDRGICSDMRFQVLCSVVVTATLFRNESPCSLVEVRTVSEESTSCRLEDQAQKATAQSVCKQIKTSLFWQFAMTLAMLPLRP